MTSYAAALIVAGKRIRHLQFGRRNNPALAAVAEDPQGCPRRAEGVEHGEPVQNGGKVESRSRWLATNPLAPPVCTITPTIPWRSMRSSAWYFEARLNMRGNRDVFSERYAT
jgi:hypothetical protein